MRQLALLPHQQCVTTILKYECKLTGARQEGSVTHTACAPVQMASQCALQKEKHYSHIRLYDCNICISYLYIWELEKINIGNTYRIQHNLKKRRQGNPLHMYSILEPKM